MELKKLHLCAKPLISQKKNLGTVPKSETFMQLKWLETLGDNQGPSRELRECRLLHGTPSEGPTPTGQQPEHLYHVRAILSKCLSSSG